MIDQYLIRAWAWLQANPITVTLVLYVAINVAKRFPPPKHPVLLWLRNTMERAMFLTWESMPGRFKWLLKGPDDGPR
jgi:hypothetical protein